MTLSLDARPAASQAPGNDIAGYWDNPAARAGRGGNDATTASTATAGAGDAPRAAVDDATEIQGTASGTRLPAGQTPDGKPIQTSRLHQGEQATVTREQTLADAGFGQRYVSSDQVVFTTGEGNDDVQVTQRDDGTLDVTVNDEQYAVRLGDTQELTIRSGAGNDVINVASNVRVNIVVDGGAGDDHVTTGAGDDRVDGGAGDDIITGGAGRNDLFGNSGADTLQGGDDVNIIHGGDGDDVLRAGAGSNFIEGGGGADAIHGGGRSDILSGGTGNDRITAADGRIYAGAGEDVIDGAGTGATVYAEVGDLVNAATGARPTVVNVEIDSRVGSTITVEGSEAFRQRVEAEMDFLRSSPNGQQMLAEFDAAAAAKGNTMTIKELANEQNGYAQTFSRDADIRNGRAGAGGDVDISYNPSFHMDEFPAPVVVLYHEMSHAYNGVNGTFQPGTYRGEGPDSGSVPNAERQAVGLETSATPFDFDNDPATPPTTANPDHLTENGLREELGMPDRPSYTL